MRGELTGEATGDQIFTIANKGMSLQATTGKIIVDGVELSVDKARRLYLPRTSKKSKDGERLPANTRMLIDYATGTSHDVEINYLDAGEVSRSAVCSLTITELIAAEVPNWPLGTDGFLHRTGKTAAGGAGGGH